MARRRQPAANTLEGRIQGAANMSHADRNALVSSEWLAGAMTSPNVRQIDASRRMPAADRDASPPAAPASPHACWPWGFI